MTNENYIALTLACVRDHLSEPSQQLVARVVRQQPARWLQHMAQDSAAHRVWADSTLALARRALRCARRVADGDPLEGEHDDHDRT